MKIKIMHSVFLIIILVLFANCMNEHNWIWNKVAVPEKSIAMAPIQCPPYYILACNNRCRSTRF